VRERFRGPLSAIARQTAIIALAAALVGAASLAVDRMLPANQKVEMIYNGKRTITEPPKDVVVLHQDERRPDLRRWQTVVPRTVGIALLAAVSGSLMKFARRRTA
jgi:hypothetical protein